MANEKGFEYRQEGFHFEAQAGGFIAYEFMGRTYDYFSEFETFGEFVEGCQQAMAEWRDEHETQNQFFSEWEKDETGEASIFEQALEYRKLFVLFEKEAFSGVVYVFNDRNKIGSFYTEAETVAGFAEECEKFSRSEMGRLL